MNSRKRNRQSQNPVIRLGNFGPLDKPLWFFLSQCPACYAIFIRTCNSTPNGKENYTHFQFINTSV
ncbi:hypothetical protein HanIR_Chr05g0249561 [Helianthus annuus]|nr:hypothetical protein HanIR_Chr05g0249561 [Helianthus annuus]